MANQPLYTDADVILTLQTRHVLLHCCTIMRISYTFCTRYHHNIMGYCVHGAFEGELWVVGWFCVFADFYWWIHYNIYPEVGVWLTTAYYLNVIVVQQSGIIKLKIELLKMYLYSYTCVKEYGLLLRCFYFKYLK